MIALRSSRLAICDVTGLLKSADPVDRLGVALIAHPIDGDGVTVDGGFLVRIGVQGILLFPLPLQIDRLRHLFLLCAGCWCGVLRGFGLSYGAASAEGGAKCH